MNARRIFMQGSARFGHFENKDLNRFPYKNKNFTTHDKILHSFDIFPFIRQSCTCSLS